MPVIAFANIKGGVGKTTTAVHFADWLLSFNPPQEVILIDADAQQSGAQWLQKLKTITYRSETDPDTLFDAIATECQQRKYVIVDAPGSLSEQTKSVLDLADLAIIPCQPTGLDMGGSAKILDFVRQRRAVRNNKPDVALFINRATPNTVLLKEAQSALSQLPYPLLKTVIYQRQCIADAPIQEGTVFRLPGKSNQFAKKEYLSLFKEIING